VVQNAEEGNMSQLADFEGYSDEIDRIARAIEEQIGFLKSILGQMAEFADADCDGSYARLRREANIVWGEAIQMADKVREVAKDIHDVTSGPVLSVREPDRSDDNWEEQHAEYLRLMNEYESALNGAHACFVKMQKHYERHIRPYREKKWGA
jgi:hypothetical protein